jgi:hypothetical protein
MKQTSTRSRILALSISATTGPTRATRSVSFQMFAMSFLLVLAVLVLR